ncbi:MAG: mechanosensitive ion channel [Bdellovibrionales bacterium]|nr:mechanosensitive ion channel [Bdellovibrionales bacterium]
MNSILEGLQDFKFEIDFPNLTSTLILLLIFLFTRSIIIRGLRKWKFPSYDIRRKWIVTGKNITTFLFLLGLIFIWGSELKTLAFSLVAIAAAVALSLKELIMCFTGGIFKTSTKLFEVGDRISIDVHRGEVIDHTVLSTSLFEIGPGEKTNQFTGRTIKLPNSMFLSNTVIVEPAGNHFTLHTFSFPFDRTRAWKKISQILLDESFRICSPYLAKADKYIRHLSQKEGVECPSTEPKVTYSLPTSDTIEFYVRIPIPFDRKAKIEKDIIESCLNRIYKLPEFQEDPEVRVKK